MLPLAPKRNRTLKSCRGPLCKWSESDKEFIEVLREYVVKNTLRRKSSGSKPNKSWREISMRLNKPVNYCKRKWHTIKYNYLILKKMIHNRTVTENMVRSTIKTTKYLDGTLDFLDKSEICDAEIPIAAYRFFVSVFGSSEKVDVDAEKLIKVQNNCAIVIKDYKQEIGMEPVSILPNIENHDSDTHTEEVIVSIGTAETVSEVHQIIRTDVEFVDPDVLPNIQIKKNDDLYEMKNDEDPIGSIKTNFPSGERLRQILMSTKQEKPSVKDSGDGQLCRFLVKYQNATIQKDGKCDLKEYMKDLAEVACNRLTPGTGKRKYFLSQIDLIVSEMLEGK